MAINKALKPHSLLNYPVHFLSPLPLMIIDFKYTFIKRNILPVQGVSPWIMHLYNKM